MYSTLYSVSSALQGTLTFKEYKILDRDPAVRLFNDNLYN